MYFSIGNAQLAGIQREMEMALEMKMEKETEM
jgi:hypothetical protein